MLPHRLTDITPAHIDALLADKSPESLTLDFKRELPRNDAKGKQDFASDVTAFANAMGGDIVFGIEDADGRAGTLAPIVCNPDEEARRLQQMATSNLDPDLPGVDITAVAMGGGYVFVLRIPRSWISPHRERINQHFYVREGTVNRRMAIPDIRSAFLRSEQAAQWIADFRAERLGKILIGDTPAPIFRGARLVVHIVPTMAFRNGVAVNVLDFYRRPAEVPVMSTSALASGLNLDGIVVYRPRDANISGEPGCGAYTQLYRDGRIEAVRVHTRIDANQLYLIHSVGYVSEVIDFVRRALTLYRTLNVPAPALLLLSLVKVKNARLEFDHGGAMTLGDARFDRDVVALPDLLLQDLDVDPAAELRPLFDLVGNAADVEGSYAYDANGKFRG